jgi:magnesium chelatase family protein
VNPVSGITLRGVQAVPVEVEVETTGGLFSVSVVGLPDAAVKEARERVRAALRSVGINMRGRVAVNLAPADIPKEGALLDLPMAVGIACSQGGLSVKRPSLFLGELALDGRLRGVRGAVPAAFLARDNGLDLYVPEDNAPEVGLVDNVNAWRVDTLSALFAHLREDAPLARVEPVHALDEPCAADPDMSDIKGQGAAKRALEIAAAGHHNILFVGSPGSGKTLLARALKGILPPLSDRELMEVILLRSAAGAEFSTLRERPFRSVHHTASSVALCGGGTSLRPGEISLASRGVLFLDEFPEFTRDVLEALRQPLEDGQITVSRASGSVVYPAKVLMVAACNPCPCGYLGDPLERCTCSASSLDRYRRKLSGPILDRIDLHISVPRLTPEELVSMEGKCGESSAEVRQRVTAARSVQSKRWGRLGFECNSEIPERVLRRHIQIMPEVKNFILQALRRVRLSGRGLSRVLRVSRTIADLAGAERIEITHVAEALAYREGEALSWMRP